MDSQCKLKIRMKSSTKLLLATSISGDVLFSIAGQLKKFPLIGFNGLVALNEITKLGLLPVYGSLRNIMSTKGSLKVIPSNMCPGRQGMLVCRPPLSSWTLEKVGRKCDIAGGGNVRRFHLIQNVT